MIQSAELRGLKTAWYDSGPSEKDIVFLIHGYLDTPRSWSHQIEAFEPKYRVIAPYGRGIGGSEAPKDKKRYGGFSMLLDHLEILRHADPQRRRGVHIVGHDVGGVHAWLLASHPHPSFRTVSIINSAHPKQYLRRLFWPRQVIKSWYMAAMQVPVMSEMILSMFHREIIKVLESEGWSTELSIKEFDEAALNAMNQYGQFVRDIPIYLRDASGPVALPALVISSEEDRYLETPTTLEFNDLASNVTVRVARGKHWIQREQPERINRLLTEFWKQHEGTPHLSPL